MRPDPSAPASDGEPSVADGVLVLSSEFAGSARRNGVFLIAAARPTMVETGVALAADRVTSALHAAGIGRRDLANIVVTHVHLDHAGGVGELARRFPAATVWVHPAGARHLVDPGRLMASAREVHGPLLSTVYGEMMPVAADRIRTAGDGAVIDLGDRSLTVVHTPGHAPHHMALLDSLGTLFTGDAAGVRIPGMRVPRPATPPPSFHAHAARDSLTRMATLSPQRLVLTHFGAVDQPVEYLADLTDRLESWCAVAEGAVRRGATVAALERELLRRFGAAEGLPAADPVRFAATGGYAANAAGLWRWVRGQRESVASEGRP
jgi:glyoxylase-like metal-dependent hydrolase (beta-lactamase superfamily II)